jgi:hypothetical protein
VSRVILTNWARGLKLFDDRSVVPLRPLREPARFVIAQFASALILEKLLARFMLDHKAIFQGPLTSLAST